jgi:hypothetical protein
MDGLTVSAGGLIFKVFHLLYLIINDGQLCLDLLDKRSNIYSDPPRNTMAKDMWVACPMSQIMYLSQSFRMGWWFHDTVVPPPLPPKC